MLLTQRTDVFTTAAASRLPDNFHTTRQILISFCKKVCKPCSPFIWQKLAQMQDNPSMVSEIYSKYELSDLHNCSLFKTLLCKMLCLSYDDEDSRVYVTMNTNCVNTMWMVNMFKFKCSSAHISTTSTLFQWYHVIYCIEITLLE
jgi:hypothetical protein